MTGRLLLYLHLIGVIMWLGPSVGAWLMYRQARKHGLGIQGVRWLEQVIRVEHIGLALLLAAGLSMLLYYRVWPLPAWLLWKLILVAAVVVPIEAVDLYISHWWLPRALRGPAPEGALTRFERWLWLAGTPLLLTAGAIGWLAVFKP